MNWSEWIRQTHRWISVAFTMAVIINGVTVVRGKYSNKLGLYAVAILALLTGLYLFVLPYFCKWRIDKESSKSGFIAAHRACGQEGFSARPACCARPSLDQ